MSINNTGDWRKDFDWTDLNDCPFEYDVKSNLGVTIYRKPKTKIVNGKKRKFYGSIDTLGTPKTPGTNLKSQMTSIFGGTK